MVGNKLTSRSVVYYNPQVSKPIGSMVLLYMVTWIPSIYPLYVSIYSSTMDPSWEMVQEGIVYGICHAELAWYITLHQNHRVQSHVFPISHDHKRWGWSWLSQTAIQAICICMEIWHPHSSSGESSCCLFHYLIFRHGHGVSIVMRLPHSRHPRRMDDHHFVLKPMVTTGDP